MSDLIFKRSVRIERAAAGVFSWHEKPGAFERLTPPWMQVQVTGRSGGIRDGATVNLRSKLGPKWVNWAVEHRDYVEGAQFRDVQRSGPFASWEHLHRVEPVAVDVEGTDAREAVVRDASVLTDEITYQLPWGAAGRLFGGGFARRELSRLFNYRHAVTQADNELAARFRSVRPMRIMIAGASGVIGRALVPFLQTQGHSVTRLVRRAAAAGAEEVSWSPAEGKLDPHAMRGVDVVINLCGEGVADTRWTPERKAAILSSRVDATRTLVAAIAAVRLERLRPFVMISASATGIYGNRGDDVLSEEATTGEGFLAGVCAAWEREAIAAEELGVRVVRLRTGVVLTPAGGALKKMLPAFRIGLGGRLGSGRAWFSWIAIDDVVGAIYHAVLDRRCGGAVNAVAPQAVTNAEFTRTLARVLRRPAWAAAPRFALKLGLGEMADEALLASARAVPVKLTEAGYEFREPTLEGALRHVLGR